MLLPKIRQTGTLIKRYKRFLADIHQEDGKIITVHCPNSGSMTGCSTPGAEVIISHSNNPKRKYAWTLEMVKENNTWIGINTMRTNKIIKEALENKTINDFGNIISIKPEIKVSAKSRLDFCLQTEAGQVYIEVKNCSLAQNNTAMFPDAVTSRGTKHLEELLRLYKNNHRAALIFCVQRTDCTSFKPAAEIDPIYAKTLKKVWQHGVEVLVYQAQVTPEEINITGKLPFST